MSAVDTLQTALLVIILILLMKSRMRLRPRGRQLILDTCALIDGRIIDLANAGFTPARLIVPQFILRELQMLADGTDGYKRERARFGLDVASKLQDSKVTTVRIVPDDFPDIKATDDKLVVLAKKLGADLYTTDYNLNKVASIEGVRVLNVNELATGIRPVALPGEIKSVKIVQKGSSKDQGVGYLEDGSMVVVGGAAKLIGKTVDIEVSRYHQTDAGKMLFAQLVKTKVQP